MTRARKFQTLVNRLQNEVSPNNIRLVSTFLRTFYAQLNMSAAVDTGNSGNPFDKFIEDLVEVSDTLSLSSVLQVLDAVGVADKISIETMRGIADVLASSDSVTVTKETTFPYTGFWRASYPGATWDGTPSSGVSGGVVLSSNMTSGTPFNGFTPAVLSPGKSGSATTNLPPISGSSTIWNGDALTFYAVAKFTNTNFDASWRVFGANVLGQPGLFARNTNGGSQKDVLFQFGQPLSFGNLYDDTYRFILARYSNSSGLLEGFLNSNAPIQVAVTGDLGPMKQMDMSNTSTFTTATFLEIATLNFRVTDAQVALMRSIVNTRYGTSF